MQMTEQHGHKNNAWCFRNKHFPALISFIPSKHYEGRLGIYWTFIQYIFFLSNLTFWASTVGKNSCSTWLIWDFSNDPLKLKVFLPILGPLF